jgi:hypothetical protein
MSANPVFVLPPPSAAEPASEPSVVDAALEDERVCADQYNIAVARLESAGFAASVRFYRHDADTEMRTIGVYVQEDDPRLAWCRHARLGVAVPVGFHFRRDDRRGYGVTLFAGSTAQELAGFIDRLIHGFTPCAQALEAAERAQEWNPHALPGPQQAALDAYMLVCAAELAAAYPFKAVATVD